MNNPNLEFRPLSPELMTELGEVLRGSWGASCWCMYPRLTEAQARTTPGAGSSRWRRDAMAELAARPRAPGLLAFEHGLPKGWIAIAPRSEFARLDRSPTTPRIDDVDVWAIPCITVRTGDRGRQIAIALIRAAVGFAAAHGAPAVEAYARAGSDRVGDGNAYFGTERMFRAAGFLVVREAPVTKRNWVPRVTMRISTDGNVQGS